VPRVVYFEAPMVRGLTTIALVLLSTAWTGLLIVVFSPLKFATSGRMRTRVMLFLASLADAWVERNDRVFDRMLTTKWDVTGNEGLRLDGRYLVISNHISWVDIFAIFRVFHDRSAFVRFFMKQVLKWWPIVGQACDALDFPFMKRYTSEYLEKHPEKRGEDLATTRRACGRYRHLPVTVMNFAEGTRFTREKHENQSSPYRHLLRPRIGGIGFALASLGDHLDGMFDVTLAYPDHDVTLWAFVTNRVPRIVVRCRRLEPPPEFYDEAITRPGPERERFKQWIEGIWREKDALLDEM
jgi:1-acyl-sn-glycerol-3-phosphate acyltransferase